MTSLEYNVHCPTPTQIVTPRDGMLSNHEVLQHITNMKARYTQEALQVGTARAMKAENLETIMKEACLLPPLPVL